MKEIQNEFNNDFGFFAVGENEIVERENTAAKKAVETVKSKNNKEVQKYKDKLKELHQAIMPLLRNLASDPEKSNLHWPDRAEKIHEFIKKIDEIIKE